MQIHGNGIYELKMQSINIFCCAQHAENIAGFLDIYWRIVKNYANSVVLHSFDIINNGVIWLNKQYLSNCLSV